MAARELGEVSLDDALKLCVMLAERDARRFERAALRWLERFIEERLPPIAEVALAVEGRAKRLAKRSTRVGSSHHEATDFVLAIRDGRSACGGNDHRPDLGGHE